MVIEEILRGLNSIGVGYDYYYYRTSGGSEVDLVLESDFGLIPIEIKYTQSVAKRQLRGLKNFVVERKCPYGIVINNDERTRKYDENLIGIPFACL